MSSAGVVIGSLRVKGEFSVRQGALQPMKGAGVIFRAWRVVFTQGINESANFRFLQRLSVIFGFR